MVKNFQDVKNVLKADALKIGTDLYNAAADALDVPSDLLVASGLATRGYPSGQSSTAKVIKRNVFKTGSKQQSLLPQRLSGNIGARKQFFTTASGNVVRAHGKPIKKKLEPDFNAVQRIMSLPTPKMLVGVEPNPGPTLNARFAKIAKKAKKTTGRKKGMGSKGRGSQQLVMSQGLAPVSIGTRVRNKGFVRKTRISASEVIAQVTSSNVAYINALQIQLNPGLPNAFPLLAQDAANYEAYEFKKLRFRYVPNCASSTAGYVAMNCDYNPQEEANTQFPSFSTFMDYGGAVQSDAWQSLTLDIKCPNTEGGTKKRTVRQAALTGAYDLHLYDHGQFNFAYGGQGGVVALGTLWADYTVDLERSRLNVQGNAQSVDYFSNVSNSSWASSVSATHMFGTSPVGFTGGLGSNLTIYPNFFGGVSAAAGSTSSLVVLQNSSANIGQNTYAVYSSIGGTVMVGTNMTNIAANTGSNGYTIINNYSSIVNSGGTLSTSSSLGIVQMTGTSLVLNLNLLTSATTVTANILSIYQIPFQGVAFTRGEKMYNEFAARMFQEMVDGGVDIEALKCLSLRKRAELTTKDVTSFVEEHKEDIVPYKDLSKGPNLVIDTSCSDNEDYDESRGRFVTDQPHVRKDYLPEKWDTVSSKSLKGKTSK